MKPLDPRLLRYVAAARGFLVAGRRHRPAPHGRRPSRIAWVVAAAVTSAVDAVDGGAVAGAVRRQALALLGVAFVAACGARRGRPTTWRHAQRRR